MKHRGRKSAAEIRDTPPWVEKIAPTRRNPQQPAPDHLSPSSKAWWSEVTDRFDLDSHDLRLLQLCCESLDRVAEARAILAKEGLTYHDKNGNPRAHPATIIERDNKIAAGRLIKELNLDSSPPDVPPRPWRTFQEEARVRGPVLTFDEEDRAKGRG